ncbi:hypothetical protein ASZ90_001067 [hydrocarbon metagenome]|uniref:Uncharacterized protein n=1 Tax=hydrocarbon metagenome TaxID=938273 RepID=A0A0W8G7Q7_9ZZZZ
MRLAVYLPLRLAVRLAMLSALALALAILLAGRMPPGVNWDASQDSLLVAGAAAAGCFESGAVADPGARLPHGVSETPVCFASRASAKAPLRHLLPAPGFGKRNLPTEGDYAFLWTRLRTLSPLCRIACG